jgi:serine/threonine-protein kinase
VSDVRFSSTAAWRAAIEHVERLLELPAPDRAEALAALARTDAPLHQRVIRLLDADRQERLTADDRPTEDVARSAAEATARFAPGATFGPFRIERLLGRGGMGEVWLASRADGLYEGRVAVKTLRAHLVHEADRERFAREGQILARLEHPHIARLYDARVDADGRLFLVLEYIEGLRIDEWCDHRRLDLAGRLRLFLQVCDAVAHAHAHLVVHRDVKPGNMLVNETGHATLLDFGIAKLLQRDEVAPTLVTQMDARVLTPEYAAPEQLTGDAVTTATDVYALGVVLYELLTGTSPYRAKRTTPALLEQEILSADPRPLGTAGTREDGPLTMTPDAVAASRGETPATLRRALKGDLQNIVAKALRKAPAERYPSALAFADDVRRFLANEPVGARPDSLSYRARKFVRRHRLAVGAGLLVVLALVGGAAGMAWQARRAQREAAKATAVKDFLLGVFQTTAVGSGDAGAAQRTTARELLERGGDRLLMNEELPADVRLELLTVLGELHANLRLNDRAERLQRKAVDVARASLGPRDLGLAYALVDLGMGLGFTARYKESNERLAEALSILEAAGRTDYESYPTALYQMGFNAFQMGEMEAARGHLQRAVAAFEATQPRQAMRQAAHRWLGQTLTRLERFDEADAQLKTALQISEELYGVGDYRVAAAHYVLGEFYNRLDRLTSAETALTRACDLFVKTIGADHPNTIDCRLMRGRVLFRLGRRDEGRPLMEAAVALASEATLNPDTFERATLSLAQSQLEEGDVASSFEGVGTVVERWNRTRPGSLPMAGALTLQGQMLTGRRAFEEARGVLTRAAAIRCGQLGAASLTCRETQVALGELAIARHDAAEAGRIFGALTKVGGAAAPDLLARRIAIGQAGAALEAGNWPAASRAAQAALALAPPDPVTPRHRELRAMALLVDGRAQQQLGREAAARERIASAVTELEAVHIPKSPWLIDARAALR